MLRLLSVLWILTLLVGCSESGEAVKTRPVRTVVATLTEQGAPQTFVGEVASAVTSPVGFQVGGRITKFPLDVGDAVKKGDLLGQIDDTELVLQRNAAEANMKAALAQLNDSKLNEKRYADLSKKKLVAQSIYDTQKAKMDVDQGAYDAAKAQLADANRQIEYAALRSPMDGVVIKKLADIGEVVAVGTPVLDIAQPTSMEVWFNVSAAQWGLVKTGMTIYYATIDNPKESYEATIKQVNEAAEAGSRTYLVKASVRDKQPTNLKLGMTVTVDVPDHFEKPLFVLPATALFEKNGQPAVWLYKPESSTVVLQSIVLFGFKTDEILVEKGLSNGDHVVISGVHALLEGQSVRLLEDKP